MTIQEKVAVDFNAAGRMVWSRFPSDGKETQMSDHPTFGAFNQGSVPTIACFNKAKTPLGVDLGKLIAAMQDYVDKCIAPVWGTPAKLIKSTNFIKDAWAVV